MTDSVHLWDVLAARGEAFGDGIALYAPDRDPLSYRRLAAQVGAIGARLREWGIDRTDRVALALPNGPDLAVTFLGVAAHAQCAPLNPALRDAELEYFLTDLRARALVVAAGSDCAAVEVARRLHIPIVEAVAGTGVAGIAELRGDPVGPGVAPAQGRPQDIAMILYTSGTIARPRRVPLTHANVCAAATNTGRALALTPQDNCLNVMPMFHAHGLTSTLLASVMFGASVTCPPGFDAEAFYGWLRRLRPTWYTAVPAMHRALLELADRHREDLASAQLRFIRSASAPLPVTVLEGLERAFRAPVIEAYGMTEAASLVTCNPLPPGRRKPRSVGLPVGERVQILDEAGHPLPAGVPGEIAIRGANVMGGYGDDPQANAAAFVGGWLRTGDYGQLDQDGYLYVVGRVKEIINRGGSKVSPAEVDEALAEHPQLAEVATFAVPHGSLGEDVAVAVVPRPGCVVSEHDVRAFAAGRLVDYKVPSRVFVVPEIPRNATGKVRRLRLTERYSKVDAHAPARPDTTTESAVAAIWADVLKAGTVDVTANFFELGGDSLMLVAIAERLRADRGRDVAPSVLLMYPTVRALARFLDAGPDGGEQAPLVDTARVAQGRDRLLRQRQARAADRTGEPG